MTNSPGGRRVILGFDGSAAAVNALEVGARLAPGSTAWITYLWVALRQRTGALTAGTGP